MLDQRNFIYSYYEIVLSGIAGILVAWLGTFLVRIGLSIAFVEDEFSNLTQIHEECRLVVELILEVFGQPGAITSHDVKVDGAQTVFFGRRFIRGHFARDAILINFTLDRLAIRIEEVLDGADFRLFSARSSRALGRQAVLKAREDDPRGAERQID